MTNWTDYLLNAESIKGIYRKNLPKLRNVRISDVSISDLGPTFEMRIILNEFPSHPPKKWMGKFDVVSIVLRISDFDTLQISKWGKIIEGCIEVGSDGSDLKYIKATGTNINLSLRGKFLSIENITGSLSEPKQFGY